MTAGEVAGVVLAAGEGRRFGGPKALVRVDGELLVERAVRVLRDGGCDPVLVVLGAAADEVRARADLGGAEAVVAEGWREGMGASLRVGLAAVEARPVRAVVVALADQPRVGPESVRRLRAAWAAGARAAVATYGGQPRNPVLLDRSTWGGVTAAAVGDAGARGWLAAHPGDVTRVACDDTGSPADIDTVDDLAALTGPAQESA